MNAAILFYLTQGTDKETLKWFREAELTNGRWAMAAVAGILFTDLVSSEAWSWSRSRRAGGPAMEWG